MKPFLDDHFLLQTKAAEQLYHEYVKELPIIDYHSHLSAEDISGDRNFENLTRIWLEGDHYKWRAMRAAGVNEKYCTGGASDKEKFQQWAATVPQTLRNPLYHWTHMELKTPLGITTLLRPSTADEIYEKGSELLKSKAFSARGILQKMNVELVCTTDDPTDSLKHHLSLQKDGFPIKILPTFRPDKAMMAEHPKAFNLWLGKLEKVSETSITRFDDMIEALRKRHDFFHQVGCRLSDHGLETMYAEDFSTQEIKTIFSKVRGGGQLSHAEIIKFKSAMLIHFAIMNHEKGWVQQFHMGALRNNNTRMYNLIGPDKGFDSIGNFDYARSMSRFFDKLDMGNRLTKTIVYNLNPRDNEWLATMLGNFNDGLTPGKMQFGSGWWFLDQKRGIENQLNTLSVMGLLSRFVGMLTDSRSFLSFPRHEYFRRILCNLLGTDMTNGEIPHDFELTGKLAQDVCYYNARNYFGFYE